MPLLRKQPNENRMVAVTILFSEGPKPVGSHNKQAHLPPRILSLTLGTQHHILFR